MSELTIAVLLFALAAGMHARKVGGTGWGPWIGALLLLTAFMTLTQLSGVHRFLTALLGFATGIGGTVLGIVVGPGNGRQIAVALVVVLPILLGVAWGWAMWPTTRMRMTWGLAWAAALVLPMTLGGLHGALGTAVHTGTVGVTTSVRDAVTGAVTGP